jgi:predicted metalloprotease
MKWRGRQGSSNIEDRRRGGNAKRIGAVGGLGTIIIIVVVMLLGEADGAKDNEFDPGQLRMGQHHELEHTDNPAVALEIAKDHLREDPLYYTKLKRMEAGECDHPEDEDAYKRIGHGKHKEE